MTNPLDIRFSVNPNNMEVTGVEIIANGGPAKAVLKRLVDENPNIVQPTSDNYQFVAIRFAGKEYRRNDRDEDDSRV